VVCPSIPGFGFSAKPTTTGWGVDRIASAWATLMARLGYARYGAQGGDWGSTITASLGSLDPQHCAGIHVTLAMNSRPNVTGEPTPEEARALAGIEFYREWDSGYAILQSTRPQTLAYGLTDSPAGQAAWILEKFWAWTDCNGHPENILSRDELLDNVMLYWVTATAASSARPYWESFGWKRVTASPVAAGERFYDLRILSERGEPLTNSLGWTMNTEPLAKAVLTRSWWVRGRIWRRRRPVRLRFCATQCRRRIASICIAAFTLAEAGIPDGRRATTHWSYAEETWQTVPQVTVEMDRIFIADRPVWTSAGMTAGIDLALGLIERDLGHEATQRTARALVVHHRRAGGQSQHSAMPQRDAKSDRVQIALAFAKQNLRDPLTVELLADAARLSPRQFRRVFRAETGLSPAKAIENLRLEAARFMLEQGRLPIEVISRETGFGDRETNAAQFPSHVRRHAPVPSQRGASAGDHLTVCREKA
jgi:transcriptional regulator GlxA family with amidase domain